ncbi:hypothetical protein Syun_020929 [Stephania yunnanensis]|uniref:Pectate lyase n=1 Tax=Stephania yunnanensis TaxID=152371 RepID=A0AAP0IF36_9MAGN
MKKLRGALFILFGLFVLAVLAPALDANIAEFDDVWKKRANEAWKAAQEAYHPDPEQVNSHLNHHVHMALAGTNGTRRGLGNGFVMSGPCKATNPIDRCWRCKKDWARNRKRLASCVLGFGRKTVGGKFGGYYVVTDPSDDDMVKPKPGTLRHAVIQEGPLWIIFGRSMVMLLGASETQTGDKVMQITVAFNHFGRGLTQRLPRCRFGFFHVVNNDYTMWTMYAIGGSSNPTIISQGNRFVAPPTLSSKEVTKREYAFPNEWQSWAWRSQGDLFLNGAIFIPSGDQSKNYKVPFSKREVISAKSGVYAGRLSRYSGALVCTSAKPC